MLAARCDDLLLGDLDGADIERVVGTFGTRFTLSVDEDDRGYIEVCQPSAALARSSLAAHWADVGNLILNNDADPTVVIPGLLSTAARWLLLGGITRLIAYWAADVDPPEYLSELQRAGFETLVRTDRGLQRNP